MRKAIADATYQEHSTPQSLAEFLSSYADALCTIEIDQTVPKWIVFDEGLLDIALDNAVSNAKLHGKKGSHVIIRAAVENGSISIMIVNEMGKYHEQFRTLQNKETVSLCGIAKTAQQRTLGAKGSTFLGMEEIYDAVQMMDGATTELDFGHSSVTFKVQFPMLEVPALGSSPDTAPLPENTLFFGIDDDRGSRAQYKGLARKLGIPEKNVHILGATYAEVENAPLEILAANVQDHDVLCIFDQNLDQYAEGRLLGTDC